METPSGDIAEILLLQQQVSFLQNVLQSVVHPMSSTKWDCMPRERSIIYQMAPTSHYKHVCLVLTPGYVEKEIQDTDCDWLSPAVEYAFPTSLRCPPLFDAFEDASAIPFETSPTDPLEYVLWGSYRNEGGGP